MRDLLYIGEVRIAGEGQRLVVSCSDIGDHNVPVFLVDPEFYDDFMEACQSMCDMPPAFGSFALSQRCTSFYWDLTYRARWRVVYQPGPFDIDVTIEPTPSKLLMPPLPLASRRG